MKNYPQFLTDVHNYEELLTPILRWQYIHLHGEYDESDPFNLPVDQICATVIKCLEEAYPEIRDTLEIILDNCPSTSARAIIRYHISENN